jgi:prepilin-type N-terminal cleavage/methylation domain-containing protein
MRNLVRKSIRRISQWEGGFSLMELLVAIGIMAAIAAVTVPLVTRFAGSGQSEAQKLELEGVKTAFDTLMGEGAIESVDANTGSSKNAVKAWTGLPLRNSAAISISGENRDLSDYMRMGGVGKDETEYWYCWTSGAEITQKTATSTCA